MPISIALKTAQVIGKSPALAVMLRDLESGPAALEDLAAAANVAEQQARRLMKRAVGKVVRICAWEKRQGPYSPVYALGTGRSVPRPVKTPEEKRLAHNARSSRWRKKNPEKVRAALRTYRRARKARIRILRDTGEEIRGY